MTAIEFVSGLACVGVWLPFVTYITMQAGVYGFLLARRRFHLRYQEGQK